jgi:hypothetical protein
VHQSIQLVLIVVISGGPINDHRPVIASSNRETFEKHLLHGSILKSNPKTAPLLHKNLVKIILAIKRMLNRMHWDLNFKLIKTVSKPLSIRTAAKYCWQIKNAVLKTKHKNAPISDSQGRTKASKIPPPKQ